MEAKVCRDWALYSFDLTKMLETRVLYRRKQPVEKARRQLVSSVSKIKSLTESDADSERRLE